MARFSFIPAAESSELAADVRDLFDDLAASLDREHRAYSGEWRPPLDVFETDAFVEVVVDIAGVPPEAVRVLFRAGVLLVAGEKAPALGRADQTFHLVEREFGRFARAIRLTGAFDVDRSSASIRHGELVIVLPRMPERRGAPHRIRVTAGEEAR